MPPMEDYNRASRGHRGRYGYGYDDHGIHDGYDDDYGYYDGYYSPRSHAYGPADEYGALSHQVDRAHDSTSRGRRGWSSPSSEERLQHSRTYSPDRHRKYYDAHPPQKYTRRHQTQSPRRGRGHEGHQHHHRRRTVSDTRSNNVVAHAAKTGLQAAMLEAVRVHGRPGEWKGDKGARVMTAAVGAAVTDAVTDMARDHPREKHPLRHKVEDLAGGWLAARLVHGPVDEMGRRRR